MNLQIFDNPEFGKVRVVEIDGEPWFVGKDVATVLGYAKPENALAAHVDDEDKTTTLIQGTGSNYKSKTVVINESGLYSLIMRSNLPKARDFKRWITSEVIPAIRKHGAYLTPAAAEQILLNPDFIIKLAEQVKQAQLERDAALEKVAELQPKADFYEQILNSDELLTATFIAKSYGMSTVKFNQLLYQMKIQYRDGRRWVLYQPYAGLNYMKPQTTPLKNGFAVTHNYWTQKGRMFLYYELKKGGIVPVCERDETAGTLFEVAS